MDVNIQKSGVVNYTADLGVFEAITSTTTGEIATFESNVLDAPCPSVLCTINPVQDLHGQDNPYPSGGGKNKLNAPDITISQSSYVLNNVGCFLPSGNYVLSFDFSRTSGADRTSTFRIDDNNGNAIFTTPITIASGRNEVAINISQDGYYLKCYSNAIGTYSKFQIESDSSATPYAPYSNICPITGHTELNLVHTGTNLWDEEWELGIYNSSTGVPEPSTTQIRSKNAIPVNGNTTYYFHKVANRGNCTVIQYDTNGTYIRGDAIATGAESGKAFTTESNTAKIRFYMGGGYGTTYTHDLSINYPSTDTSYHAYTGTTTTTDLGTTVYGGTLDVVSGVLTIDRAYVTLTSSQNWTYSSGWSDSTTSVFYDVDVNTNIKYPNYDYQSIVLCDKLIPSTRNEVSNKDGKERLGVSGAVTQPSLTVRILSSRASTTQQFKDWLDSNPVHGVYELATPITTQLTPQEVKSLLGSNNFYHDGNGEIQVKYFTIRSYSLDGFFENNTDRLSISQTFINSIDFIEI